MESGREHYRSLLTDEHEQIRSQLDRHRHLAYEGNRWDPTGLHEAQLKRETLRLVERALQRLDCGQFGYCLNCHAPIDEERLQIVPEAELCIACQRRAEKQGRAWPLRAAA